MSWGWVGCLPPSMDAMTVGTLHLLILGTRGGCLYEGWFRLVQKFKCVQGV